MENRLEVDRVVFFTSFWGGNLETFLSLRKKWWWWYTYALKRE
jgi:hypothetical protein